MLPRLMRSPVFPILLFLNLFFVFYVGRTSAVTPPLFVVLALVIPVAWCILLIVHNKYYPKQKIKLLSFIPAEFSEMDEGQQWMTYRACRNVYMYYSIALPLCFVIYVCTSSHSTLEPLYYLAGLGLGQYVVYSSTLYRYSR